jgi:Domain of unknown function (DUF4398)
MTTTSLTRRSLPLRAAASVAGVLMLAGCASVPPPTASLQAAKQAISNAERQEAGRYAAGELAEARTQLASADTAVGERKMVVAERFADESRTEADLASARASAVKAKLVNDEMMHSTGTLIQEMQRNPGDKP